MAYTQMDSAPPKLSFAKIAAMPAPSMIPALPNTYKDNKSRPSAVPAPRVSADPKTDHAIREQSIIHSPTPENFEDDVDKVRSAVEELRLAADRSSNMNGLQAGLVGEAFDDGHSQVSSSSVKQQSFDTTSQASVTTFAMDEKESIRPDDSASVRAVEDDENISGLSRHSSFQHEAEVHVNGQRPIARPAVPNVTIAARRYPGLTLTNPPRFGDLPVSPVSEHQLPQPDEFNPPAPAIGEGSERLVTLHVTPDEKLLEALASPKDRLSLLQLEERVMAFIIHGREDVLELPPQNSFNRLLTHKLADYYTLAHQVSEDNNSVRIFRTTHCSLPTSLAEIAKSIHIGPQPMSAATQMKIMRRAQLGRQFSTANSTAASSSVASKTTSENGGDFMSEEGLLSPSEGTPGRDKPKSREEREAQYKAVRERIFGDFQESVTSENGSAGETSASLSRSSSTSGGKKKSRKQRTPKDDSFTRRSEFVAYGPMHLQQAVQPAYHDVGYPAAYQHQGDNQLFGSNQMISFPTYESNLNYGGHNVYPAANGHVSRTHGTWESGQQSQTGAMFGVDAMHSVQQYSGMMPPMRDQFAPSMPTMPNSAGWMQPQFANAFAQPTNGNPNMPWQHSSPGMSNPNYQYGQGAPSTFANSNPYVNQQAGNFAYTAQRSLFNPQTRSFVPNNTSDRGGGRNGRRKGMQNGANPRSNETSATGNPAKMLRNESGSSRPKEDSLQQKYGAPAHLPKKPPPSQVSSHFSTEPNVGAIQAQSVPSSNGTSVANGSGQ